MLVLGLLAAAAVLAAYSNHFHNAFQFDDSHVIQNNAYVRSLRNIPLFFRDGSTFSSVPNNADYRPLTSASFALNYRRAGGLDPVAFHVTQWICSNRVRQTGQSCPSTPKCDNEGQVCATQRAALCSHLRHRRR